MAAATTLSMAQYLETSYSPEPEYVDGELRQRNVGKFDHARIQALLAAWFTRNERIWKAVALTEQSVIVSPARVRIPDVTLVPFGETPDCVVDPPLLVIEILSSADSYGETQDKCEDYRKMGVQNMWIVDPSSRTGRMCVSGQWVEARRLEAVGTPMFVDLETLFQDLDASRRV